MERIKAYGFRLVIGSVLTMVSALREHYAGVRRNGTPLDRVGKLPSFDDCTRAVGIEKIEALSTRFADPAGGDRRSPANLRCWKPGICRRYRD